MDNNEMLIRMESLIENPTPRIPVCLCLDISGSMQGSPIEELNKGVKLFYEAIQQDETALYAAEICIVTFNDVVSCATNFENLKPDQMAPIFTASGMTLMGEAVNKGLDLLEERKELYKTAGSDYYQPWLVLMTDGSPNGSRDELSRAVARTQEMISKRKLTVFPVGIGPKADMNVLAMFAAKNRPPLKLQGLKFREFFDWLSKSVSVTSQSIPGETVKLSPDISGWASLD